FQFRTTCVSPGSTGAVGCTDASQRGGGGMKKAATIRDVAARAGVSVSVVSRVLNGTGPVAAPKRAQVLDAIEALAYRPRAAARQLSQGRSDTVGLLLADLTNPFFARLADRVVAEARARDLQILLM